MYTLKGLTSRIILLSALLISFSFSGCTRYGKLDDGNSIIEVSFVNIPNEFYQYDDSVLRDFSIDIELVNLSTDKHYLVQLNKDNDFSQTLHLEDGNYDILKTKASHPDIFWIEAGSEQESIIASMDSVAYLNIHITNTNEFLAHYQAVYPNSEIISSSIFSRKIQIHGNVIQTQNLLSSLDIDSSQSLLPFESVTCKDSTNKISVTLYNPYDTATTYRDCELLEFTIFANSIVLPGGVKIGSDTESVCNAKSGIYGDPNSLSGNLLYGMGVNDLSTNIIYKDSLSADELILTTDESGEYITKINYKLHVEHKK